MKNQILTLVFSTGLLLSSCSNTAENKTSVSTILDTAKSEPVQKTPEEILLTKKDTVKTDELTFLVKNITEPEIDRSKYSVTKPSDDEKYIAVQFWVKNISNKEVTLEENDFVLKDQDDA